MINLDGFIGGMKIQILRDNEGIRIDRKHQMVIVTVNIGEM